MSHFNLEYLPFFFIVFFFSLLSTFLFYRICINRKILIHQDDYKRNNIVNCSGAVLVAQSIILLSFLIFFSDFSDFIYSKVPRPYIFFFSILTLFIISFLDDIKPLDFRIRLFTQFTVIFISLSLITFDSQTNIPIKIQQYLVIIFWVYIINISNFIDGLDGFLLIQAISTFIILLIKFILDNELLVSTLFAAFLLPCCLGLFFFNFPKAKVFLGDTGSIFIGFIFGFVFFELIFNKQLILALSIFLYPFFDVTITLIKRVINKKPPWSRDFDYFFLQKVFHQKLKHTAVTVPYILYNLLLICNCGLMIYLDKYYLFTINIILCFLLCLYFKKKVI